MKREWLAKSDVFWPTRYASIARAIVVVGEGMGHAIRSRVVLDHLLATGHEIEIMASSRAAEFLAKRFAEVHEIRGLHFIYDENRARIGRSVLSNRSKQPMESLQKYSGCAEELFPMVAHRRSWSDPVGLSVLW